MIGYRTAALALGLALSLPAAARADEKVKVLVVPYAPLYDSLPRMTGERIANTLREELGSNDAFEGVPLPDESAAAAPADAPKRGPTEAQLKALEAAKADLGKGKDLLKKRKVKPALDALQKAVGAMEKNAEALLDPAPLVEAYLRQAVALFLMGKEDQATKGPIASAVRLAPALKLEAGEDYAPVFLGEVEKVRKKLLAEDPGSLRVDTTPPGAQIAVDGRDAATSPVLVTGLVPGVHYVRIKPPGATDAYVQKVEVPSGGTARITPDAGGKKEGPVTALVSHLSRNELNDETRSQVKGLAEKTGARFVVIGGAYAEGANMGIVSFVFDATRDAFAELQMITLDRDMLGATIEINKLSGEVGLKADALGDPATLPRPVAANAKAGAEKINEVSFSATAAPAAATAEGSGDAAAGGGAAVGAGREAGGRKPLTGGRKPITGGGARPEEPVEAAAAPAKAAPAIGIGKRPAVVTRVDESGLVFKEKPSTPEPAVSGDGEGGEPSDPDAGAAKTEKYKWVGGTSIEDERSFEEDDNKEGGGLLSKWWFWTGAAVVAGGAVTAGILAAGADAPTAATGTVTWTVQ